MTTVNRSSWVGQSLERVTSLVSEIIRPYKATIHKKHCDELHNILMDTGKDIVLEMRNLEKDNELIKRECELLDKFGVLAESDKLKFKDELRKCQKECGELKERLVRSRNDKMITELKGNMHKMEGQLLERDDTIRSYRQKFLFFEKKIADMGKELKDLKDQKLASDEEMRLKEIEANHAMEELRRKNVESSENAKDYRCQMFAAKMEKSRLEGIIEEMKHKEFEAGQTVEELRRLNSKACDDIVVLRADKMRVEEELKDFKDQKLKLVEIILKMRLRQIAANHTLEELRRTNTESSENEKILKCQMLAAEEANKKIIQEMKRKEFESHQTMEELRTRNLKACDDILGLKNRMLAIEEEKTRYETVIEEMKRKEFEADQKADDLMSRNLKAHDDIVGLRKHILGLEEDKRTSDQIILKMKQKQMDDLDNLSREYLEGIDKLKRKIAKNSKDANTSLGEGEKQNLESGSSIFTERASNVLPQIETTEVIDNRDQAIPGESTSNSELRPNLGEQENISSCPSSLQSGLPDVFFPKRKRSPRANGDDNSRQRKKLVPIPTHEGDVSLSADMSGNPESGFTRNISSPNSKTVAQCDSQSQQFKSNSSTSESCSDSDDDDSLSDSRLEEMVRSIQR